MGERVGLGLERAGRAAQPFPERPPSAKNLTSQALAADTASMAVMEAVDNAVMLAVPGAMEAGLADPLFWGSLAVSLLVAAAAAFPVNRWLIARGRGHAVVHAHHGQHH